MVAMILAMHFFESTILVFRKHPGPTTLNFRGLRKSWLGTQGDTNQIQLMFTDLPWLGPRDGFWTKQTHGGRGLVIGGLLKSRTNFTWTYQLSRSVGSEFLGFFWVARGVLLRKLGGCNLSAEDVPINTSQTSHWRNSSALKLTAGSPHMLKVCFTGISPFSRLSPVSI